MTLLLNNDDVRQLLTMEMTIDALDRSYRGTITGETVCRPRIDIEIPTRKPGYTYCWGTMGGGSSDSGYFAIRTKSDSHLLQRVRRSADRGEVRVPTGAVLRSRDAVRRPKRRAARDDQRGLSAALSRRG